MPFMIWRICAIVTEQSHALNCRLFCIFVSKVILTSCCFCLATVVLHDAVCGVLFRLGMAHLSASGDSIVSLFIFVRI